MSDLQEHYQDLRDVGNGHYATLRELARRTGIDIGTLQRVLRRADQDRRDQRPARPATPEPAAAGLVACTTCTTLVASGRRRCRDCAANPVHPDPDH